jgi:hypothetical protein
MLPRRENTSLELENGSLNEKFSKTGEETRELHSGSLEMVGFKTLLVENLATDILTVGCGKTVLFSSIVKSIENRELLDATGGLSAYFYCLYRKGAQHDLAPILQSFIAQLCPSNYIPGVLQSLFDRHNSRFPPGIPSDDELKETFLAMVHELRTFNRAFTTSDRNVFILIDALDELPLVTSRDEIIGFLDDLASYRIPTFTFSLQDGKSPISAWDSSHRIRPF